MRQAAFAIALACPVAGLLRAAGGAAGGADWPQWRGPGSDDVSTERSGWSDGEWPLRESWTAAVGEGCSSPVVAEGRLYATGWSGGMDTVRCLDAASGREIWRRQYPCPKYGRHAVGDKGRYGGPTSTPTYDPSTKCLYTLSIDGDLACWYAARGGEKVWGVNLYDAFRVRRRPDTGGERDGRSRRDYGYTTAPFVHGRWVIVEAGSDRGNLVAFDKRTGRPEWTSECTDPAGHTGGFARLTVEGIPCLAVLTLRHLVVVRLDGKSAGRTLAEFPWQTDFANSIASPAASGTRVLVTSGYNQKKTMLLEVSPGGARKLWESPHHSKVCSPVIHGGHVYTAYSKVRCLDLATGRAVWHGAVSGADGSCVVTADDRLIVFGGRDLILAETARRSPDRYTELARVDGVFRTTENWPHVVISHGRVYCRNRAGNVRCFRIGR